MKANGPSVGMLLSILREYIAHVDGREGTTFLDKNDWGPEEWAVLSPINDEVAKARAEMLAHHNSPEGRAEFQELLADLNASVMRRVLEMDLDVPPKATSSDERTRAHFNKWGDLLRAMASS